MINTDKYEGHTPAPWRYSNGTIWGGEGDDYISLALDLEGSYQPRDVVLVADAPLLLAEVKRFRQMCLSKRLCYDCLSDVYVAGLSDENPVDAYWCGYCDEPMKGLIE